MRKTLFISTDPFEDVDDSLAIILLLKSTSFINQYENIIIATSNDNMGMRARLLADFIERLGVSAYADFNKEKKHRTLLLVKAMTT